MCVRIWMHVNIYIYIQCKKLHSSLYIHAWLEVPTYIVPARIPLGCEIPCRSRLWVVEQKRYQPRQCSCRSLYRRVHTCELFFCSLCYLKYLAIQQGKCGAVSAGIAGLLVLHTRMHESCMYIHIHTYGQAGKISAHDLLWRGGGAAAVAWMFISTEKLHAETSPSLVGSQTTEPVDVRLYSLHICKHIYIYINVHMYM